MALRITDLLNGGLGGADGGGSGGGTPTPTPTPAPIPNVTGSPTPTPTPTVPTGGTSNDVVTIYINGSDSPADVNMVVGQTVVINSTATGVSGTSITGSPIGYVSSDTSVVTVTSFDTTGRQAQLNAVGVGSAFITAATTNPDGSGTLVRFRVNVAASAATEVSRKIVPASKTMLVGETFQFSLEITYSDGSKNTITHGQWSSGAGSITTEGVLTATTVGTWTVDSPGAVGASVVVSTSVATPGPISMQPNKLNVDYVLDSFVAPPSQDITLTNTSIEKQASITFTTPDASITVSPNNIVLNPGESGKVTVSFSANALNKLAEGSIDELITLNLYLSAGGTGPIIPPPTPTPPAPAPIPTQGSGGGTPLPGTNTNTPESFIPTFNS